MPRHRGSSAVILLVVTLVCRPAAAQEHVTLEVIPAKRTFYQGEIVALTLRFHTDAPGVYGVNNASGDRSGRTSIDRFTVDRPERTTDPLADYYRASDGYIGGGPSAEINLETTVDIHVELNEWLRFDRPGVYRVSVTSQRVRERTRTWTGAVVAVTSQTQFEIVPADAAWAAAALRDAAAVLDQTALNDLPPVPFEERTPARERFEHALRVLRFLGTPDAARELVRQLALDHGRAQWRIAAPGSRTGASTLFHYDRSFELMAGAFGSPHRELIVSEMERRAASRETVSTDFTRTIELLRRLR